MVQTGMASPYQTAQFPQNGEALPIKTEAGGGGGGGTGGGGGGGGAAGTLKDGPPVPTYSPPVPVPVSAVNGIDQQNVSTVGSRLGLYLQVGTQKFGRRTERDVQVKIISRIAPC